MTDKEKLYLWNDVCIKKKWAKPYELERWLLECGVQYTPFASVVPANIHVIDNEHNAELQAAGATEELLATMILEVLTGMLSFTNSKIEKIFWRTALKRFKTLRTKVPKDLIPPYVLKEDDPIEHKEN